MSVFRLIAKLGIDSTEFTAGLKRSESQVESSMKSIGGMIAGAFTTAALLEFARSAVKATADIADLADQLQITTDEVQQLQKAADHSGVSFDRYASALGKIRKLKADFAAGDPAAAGVFSRTGLNPKDSDISLLRQVGGLPDSQAFEILDARSAKLKSSLADIKALGPLELVSKGSIDALDHASDKVGDIQRTFRSIVGGAIGRKTSSFLMIEALYTRMFGDKDNSGHTMGKKRMAEEESMYGYVDWMKGKQPVDSPQMSTLADFAKLKSKDGLSRIDMGDRANVGGFFGPNSDLNRSMQRSLVSIDKQLQEINKTISGVSHQ